MQECEKRPCLYFLNWNIRTKNIQEIALVLNKEVEANLVLKGESVSREVVSTYEITSSNEVCSSSLCFNTRDLETSRHEEPTLEHLNQAHHFLYCLYPLDL
ncbi:hypothetical protein R5R35_002515 [Gryllus longicercus]|uniref:Uncharacterized protein n=1 Tax=Gryllus longicercus TaxID=2509291 RepID=A0AAN9VDB8_9ORTH